MPQGKHRGLQDVQRFIRKRLPLRILRDLQGLRIVKEADVECSAYYHLRRYIGEDPKWRVFARIHVPITRHYVDLLMFRKNSPVIAIELKWGRNQIGSKDRRSLVAALQKLRVNKVYWISALSTTKPREPLIKEDVEKGKLFRVIVRLGFSGAKLDDWKQRRRLFRADMPVGKGRQALEAAVAKTASAA